MRTFDVIVKWNDGSRKVTALTNLRVLPFDGQFNKRLDVCKVSQHNFDSSLGCNSRTKILFYLRK